MKKNLTGPFWFLLIFGLLYLLGAILALYNYLIPLKVLDKPLPSAWFIMRFFASPAIFLVEAIIYWRLRRYNTFPRASWAHCCFMVLAYWLPVFFMLPQLFQNKIIVRTYTTAREPTRYLFWSTMIIAQVFFASVVIRSIQNKRAPNPLSENSENLLDDFV